VIVHKSDGGYKGSTEFGNEDEVVGDGDLDVYTDEEYASSIGRLTSAHGVHASFAWDFEHMVRPEAIDAAYAKTCQAEEVEVLNK